MLQAVQLRRWCSYGQHGLRATSGDLIAYSKTMWSTANPSMKQRKNNRDDDTKKTSTNMRFGDGLSSALSNTWVRACLSWSPTLYSKTSLGMSCCRVGGNSKAASVAEARAETRQGTSLRSRRHPLQLRTHPPTSCRGPHLAVSDTESLEGD